MRSRPTSQHLFIVAAIVLAILALVVYVHYRTKLQAMERQIRQIENTSATN